MSRSSTNQVPLRRFEVVRSKFNPKVTKQLLQFLATIDWNSSLENICNQLYDVTQSQLGGKYVWMIGANPTYFIQYQIDSYAIIKGYGKVILVWKPKYLEYPSLIKLSQFGPDPKLIKSMEVIPEHRGSDVSENLENKIIEYTKMYYGFHFFNQQETKFETDMLTQIKHYISRTSKDSYWHCVIDYHGSVNVSSKSSLYLKLRIKGVKQKYDKDLIIFSQKGLRQFALKGKGIQIVSFAAMLLIFVAIVSCPSGSETGFCSHKNQMILASAAVMMGLMGMRVVSRNKQKKKLDKRIKDLQEKQKKQ